MLMFEGTQTSGSLLVVEIGGLLQATLHHPRWIRHAVLKILADVGENVQPGPFVEYMISERPEVLERVVRLEIV